VVLSAVCIKVTVWEMLRSEVWYMVTNVSEQPAAPMYKVALSAILTSLD
jgi:hypothetical protein